MANVIVYNPASAPIANKVVRYVRSVQEADYADTPNVLINHDGSGDNPQVTALIAAGVPMSRWKVSGANVLAFDAADDAVIDAENTKAVVEAAPDFERIRRENKSRRELISLLSRWDALTQAEINSAVKHIATIIS